MKIRKSLILMLAVLFICAASINVYAAEPNVAATRTANGVITPLWVNTVSIDDNLSFSGSTANCSAMIIGIPSTSSISGTLTLLRKNGGGTYTSIKTWSKQVSGAMLNFNETASVTRGYTYRLSLSAVVYSGTSGEPVSTYVEKYCS